MQKFQIGDRVIAKANRHVGEFFHNRPGIITESIGSSSFKVQFDHTDANGGYWSTDTLLPESPEGQAEVHRDAVADRLKGVIAGLGDIERYAANYDVELTGLAATLVAARTLHEVG